MHGDTVGASLDERLEITIRVLDHQVHVERQPGDLADGLDDRRANGDVGHEVPVHDVDVHQIRAAALDLAACPRRDGRSRLIVSDGAIRTLNG